MNGKLITEFSSGLTKVFKLYYYMFKFYNKFMSVVITHKCNIKCEHCCMNATPDYNGVISDDLLIECARQSKGYLLSCYGGEPLLYPEKCLLLSKESQKMGRRIAISTNGFWGNDKYMCEYVKNQINPIAITLSVGDVHSKYISNDTLISLYNYFKNTDILISGINVECNELWRNTIKMPFPVFSEDLTKHGRAADLNFTPIQKLKVGKIVKCSRRGFIIEENGDIFPECANEIYGCKMGNIKTDKLSDICKYTYRPRCYIKSLDNEVYDYCSLCKKHGIHCMNPKWENRNFIGILDHNSYTEIFK